jgi:hypothetical protein
VGRHKSAAIRGCENIERRSRREFFHSLSVLLRVKSAASGFWQLGDHLDLELETIEPGYANAG